MEQTAPTKRRFTVEEYFRIEADSPLRHDYYYGQIIEMQGGSYAHSLIIANIIGELRDALKGKPCRVFDANLRVRSIIEATNLLTIAKSRALRNTSWLNRTAPQCRRSFARTAGHG